MGFGSLFSSGGKSNSSTSTANNSTNDNKRTVSGDGINAEGNGNTFQVERADAAVLAGITGLLSDVSADNTATAANFAARTDATTARYLDAANQARRAELEQTSRVIEQASSAFATAKDGDSEKLVSVVKTGAAAAVVLGLGAVLLVAFRKR